MSVAQAPWGALGGEARLACIQNVRKICGISYCGKALDDVCGLTCLD